MPMLTREHIEQLIENCRVVGAEGVGLGVQATLPKLEVDVVEPTEFLGAGGNPAIFVNKDTYRLLHSQHSSWKLNETIAVKEDLLSGERARAIGALTHEVGHSFNISSKLPNTEGNAYIFEIQALRQLAAQKKISLSQAEVETYLKSRVSYFKMATERNPRLADLVKTIEQEEAPSLVPMESLDRSVTASRQIGMFATSSTDATGTTIHAHIESRTQVSVV